MGFLSKLFDFSTPNFDEVNTVIDRLNAIDDQLDKVFSRDDCWASEQEAKEGEALLDERRQIMGSLEDKAVIQDAPARRWFW